MSLELTAHRPVADGPLNIDSLLSSLAPGGQDFERLCLWLLQNAPEYKSKLKHVWLWDDWPGRWGAEAGIDLVAETFDGKLWAVQAKHYDPAYYIRKADLDSFLSESSRAQFSFRLLIATTDRLGPTAKRTIAAQEKQVAVLLRTKLAALDVEWPSLLERLRPAKPTPSPEPHPYQRDALQAVVDGLGEHDRGQLVMACGTGKTLVARFLHDALESRRTLVLVPSLSLVEQTLHEWLSVSPLDYLAVCSDETVAAADHDAVIASTSELGVPVTTDPDEIAAFLRRRRPGVVFATYQSSPRIADAQRGGAPAFDLALCDEAHRCTGPLAGAFATILDPARIKASRRLFMTATPRYFTGRVKKAAKEEDWEVASMDDEERFGPVFHRLGFAQAIEQDLLSDYQVVVVGVTNSEAHALAERGAFVTREGKPITDARTLARQIGLLRAMAKHDLHRVVSFHSRIDGASRFASSLLDTNDWLPPRRRASGEIWAEHVSGEMTSGERKVKLNRLRSVTGGERGLLANARCLSEGVDVPTLDGVAFIDPRRSQIDVVQAVGRAIRRAPDKSLGTIVIPVLVLDDDNPEVALASSEFDRVWEIVRALRDHDEDLAEEVDELRRQQGRSGSVGQRPRKIVLDLPVRIEARFGQAFDAKVVEAATSSWERSFGAMLRFTDREGHAGVPPAHVENGVPLGRWQILQRRLYRTGRLGPQRAARLEALQGWSWEPWDDSWVSSVAAARRYSTEHGDLLPPRSFVTADGFRLGLWLNSQRGLRRAGALSADRIRELDHLGMEWEPIEGQWGQAIEAAHEFFLANGHLRVRRSFVTPGGFRLGEWLLQRRTDRNRGRLSAERIAALDSVGMVWAPVAHDWERGIAAVKEYRREHRHIDVPSSYVTSEGFRLGRWLERQRGWLRTSRLSQDRVAELDALGIVWDPRRDEWSRNIAIARAYWKANGHLRPLASYTTPDGFRIGQWLSTLRHKHRRGTRGELSDTQIAELDAIGMTWDPMSEDWERGISAASAYRHDQGHLRVPQTHVDRNGFKLGTWIASKRQARRKGVLSAARIADLDDLGMVWNPPKGRQVADR